MILNNPSSNSHFPIGVFDSGLGGLTIVKALKAILPTESLIYFGDTAHLPYGDKSPELVKQYALSISKMLINQPVKAIVIACNTASAVGGKVVEEISKDIPVFNVIEPAVKEAVKLTKNSRIGIIGTQTTIRTSIYRQQIIWQSPKAEVIEKATPLLVPMIEEGWLHNKVSQDVIDAYMSDTGFQQIDTLILGCTHYPLIKTQIEKYFLKNYAHIIHVVDSSLAVARAVKVGLSDKKLLQEKKELPNQYYLSDLTPNFEASAELFLGEKAKFEKYVI